jgi:hypothetical protein
MTDTVTEQTFTMMQTENEEDGYAIKINEGQFLNVIYTIGSVKIHEEGDEARLEFDFTPIKGNIMWPVEKLYENEKLQELAGQILKYMLEVSVNDALNNVNTQA